MRTNSESAALIMMHWDFDHNITSNCIPRIEWEDYLSNSSYIFGEITKEDFYQYIEWLKEQENPEEGQCGCLNGCDYCLMLEPRSMR